MVKTVKLNEESRDLDIDLQMLSIKKPASLQ